LYSRASADFRTCPTRKGVGREWPPAHCGASIRRQGNRTDSGQPGAAPSILPMRQNRP
jgi:hypothetical protein